MTMNDVTMAQVALANLLASDEVPSHARGILNEALAVLDDLEENA